MIQAKHVAIPYRRKRTQYTDYKQRLSLLKSRKPRLVIRKSLRYIIAQIVEYRPNGDRVISGISSRELEKYGWKYSKKNIPAAYLTGLLLGRKSTGTADMIVDMGMQVSNKESRIYAVVKGMLDSGMKIPVSEEILPSEDRIKGKHVAEYASKNPSVFSGYKKNAQEAKDMPSIFESVKEKIMK